MVDPKTFEGLTKIFQKNYLFSIQITINPDLTIQYCNVTNPRINILSCL